MCCVKHYVSKVQLNVKFRLFRPLINAIFTHFMRFQTLQMAALGQSTRNGAGTGSKNCVTDQAVTLVRDAIFATTTSSVPSRLSQSGHLERLKTHKIRKNCIYKRSKETKFYMQLDFRHMYTPRCGTALCETQNNNERKRQNYQNLNEKYCARFDTHMIFWGGMPLGGMSPPKKSDIPPSVCLELAPGGGGRNSAHLQLLNSSAKPNPIHTCTINKNTYEPNIWFYIQSAEE